MVPGAGAPADLTNAGLYAQEGDWGNAIFSGVAAIPGLGEAGMFGAKLAKGIGRIADDLAEIGLGAAKLGGRYADDLGALGSRFTKNNYRANLIKATGAAPPNSHAHHVFPQQFADPFEQAGITNMHDPRLMQWWTAGDHLRNAKAYNQTWDRFLAGIDDLKAPGVREQILDFGPTIMERFGQSFSY
jgi:hypothetical protein